MRRIILAACAAVLLHAAPSMAAECTNLALPANGGLASTSSNYNSAYSAATINNGRREDRYGDIYWNDGTRDVWPDWAQVEWSGARTINRIIARGPVFQGIGIWPTAAERTLSRTRIQYWDGAAWVDVVGEAGQDNPIGAWVMPYKVGEGREVKQFDFRAVSTTKIRVLFEDSLARWSFLDELEAYDARGCGPVQPICRDVALDGTASASSVHSSGLYPAGGVNNGRAESGATKGYWNDDTNGVWPDWVQVAFDTPQTIGRVSARIPLAGSGFPTGEITLRRTRIQYWDDATSTWVDVTGRSGQSNPIVDWTGPIGTADGSETKSFDLATPVTTTKIRALIEEGSSDGWSWLDELQAYAPDCLATDPTPRGVGLALPRYGGTAVTSTEQAWAFTLNDGLRRETGGYWLGGVRPIDYEWASIVWPSAQTIDRIVLRGPWGLRSDTLLYWTLGDVRVQWWNDDRSVWVDVAGRRGQDNPILDWQMPIDGTDGSEVKQFDFDAVRTTRIRARFDEGNLETERVYMEEIEAWRIS